MARYNWKENKESRRELVGRWVEESRRAQGLPLDLDSETEEAVRRVIEKALSAAPKP